MKTNKSVKQLGFTILELMISLLVGAFILAGVMFTYVGMKVTTSDTMDMGELQESGRLAMDILKREIELAGFWGNFILTPTGSMLTVASPSNPGNDCFAGVNNRTFPELASNAAFKVIYAKEAQGNTELNCVSSPLQGSDILQVKRVLGQEVTTASSTASSYFVAGPQQARFMRGTGDVITPANDNEKVWEYSHNVYFIQDQTYQLNGKSVNVPTLKRKRLTQGDMHDETVMEGIESLRFLFGLDTNGDDRVDMYKTSSQMSMIDWEQQSAVVTSVQVFLLVRALEQDSGSAPRSQTFVMGGQGEQKKVLTFNDRYRRKLLTSTIRLVNVGNDKWII